MTKGRTLTCMSCTLGIVFLIVMSLTIRDLRKQDKNIGNTNDAADSTDCSRCQNERGLTVSEPQVNLYVDSKQIKYTFTTEELTRVEQCHETAIEDRKQSREMFRKDKQNLPVFHHTYLKQNDTVVIEVGGNVGAMASQMIKMYNHRHVLLEPVASFANRLRERFQNYKRITVLNFGLGKKSETIYVKESGDATSMFRKKSGTMPLYVMNSTEFFMRIGVGVFSVDLLLINCEGCEFDILENLVITDMVMYFKNIQFQPHGHLKSLNNEDWIKRYCMIQEDLSRTHRLTFQYKHLWENWRRLDLLKND